MNQNEWRDGRVEVPAKETGHDVDYLVIVSGKATKNIEYHHGYALAGWTEADGWIIDGYPGWRNPQVECWMPLPEAPEALWSPGDDSGRQIAGSRLPPRSVLPSNDGDLHRRSAPPTTETRF